MDPLFYIIRSVVRLVLELRIVGSKMLTAKVAAMVKTSAMMTNEFNNTTALQVKNSFTTIRRIPVIVLTRTAELHSIS